MFRYLAELRNIFGGTSRFRGTQVEKHCQVDGFQAVETVFRFQMLITKLSRC
jgi:hypothetical protein